MPADLHHIPAAFQQPRPTPQPIPMPERPGTRARYRQMGEIELAARQAAHADGVRQGYVQGWRHGVICGAVLAALLVGTCWALWPATPASGTTSAR